MAEFLIKAKPHWKDNFTQEQIDAMSEGDRVIFEGRSQIGDIIVVKPDGWGWGKRERLPNYIVIKIPGLSIEDAQKYEESLSELKTVSRVGMPDTQVMTNIKRRKYAIPQNVVTTAIQTSKNVVEILSVNKDTFLTNLVVKDK